MDARGIGKADDAIHFAQILGMADPLSLALAQARGQHANQGQQ
jgi:hypothetical protein